MIMTIKEVAGFYSVDPATVTRWVRQGAIKAFFLPHVGKRRVARFHAVDVPGTDEWTEWEVKQMAAEREAWRLLQEESFEEQRELAEEMDVVDFHPWLPSGGEFDVQ